MFASAPQLQAHNKLQIKKKKQVCIWCSSVNHVLSIWLSLAQTHFLSLELFSYSLRQSARQYHTNTVKRKSVPSWILELAGHLSILRSVGKLYSPEFHQKWNPTKVSERANSPNWDRQNGHFALCTTTRTTKGQFGLEFEHHLCVG